MFKRQFIFHGFETFGWFLLCAAAVIAALVLIVVLMRFERKLVPRKVGYTLLALRMSVLVLLFVTLMQPVISWTLDRDQTGRILVAVDLSESMSTADNHAGKAEKLRWARALGMIGNAEVNDRIDRWITAYEEDREPEWVAADETQDPDRREKLETARKETVEGIFREIDGLERKEIARRLLNGTASPLLPQLQEIANVDLIIFAGKSEPSDDRSFELFVKRPPDTLIGGISNLSEALIPSTATADTSRLLGVILLTDGRDNGGGDPVGASMRLGQLEAPVYPVLLGSKLRPRDLAIASLDYPLSVFKDDHPLLKATLNTSGFENKELEIVLEREGEEPITKTITPVGPTADVEFDLDAESIGRTEYTLRTEVRKGETRDDNNEKTFAMSVVDDKAHVLLVEGEARWEFRYLDNALSRDERVEIEKVVFQQPYVGALQDTFFRRRLDLPADPDDLKNSPFAEQDLVILGDVDPADLSEIALKLLDKYVAESGGTLVMIAGKRHFPLSYRSPIVARLLPVTKLRPINITGAAAAAAPTERGFRLQLTPDGENLPMFQFDPDPLANREIWNELPGHMWGLLGQAKPGATVLVSAIQPADVNLLDAERRNAVIVHQHYGFGQVLWVGIDSTWRWRHRVGDEYHHRFWGQMARWASENRATAGNESVKFGPDRNDINLGEDAVIRARWTQSFLRKFPNLKAKAELHRVEDDKPAKLFTTLDLEPVEGRPLVYEARAVSLPVGEYEVKLIVEGADIGDDPIADRLYVNQRQTLELSDLSSNPELLAQLAEVSGGRLFYPDEIQEIPDLFQNPTETMTVRKETTLWDHWLIMTVFFALLTFEWVLRKLNGLP